MENLTPLMVVGTQVTPASTAPSGVVKYGDIPFSLRLMPKPGPNLSFPLISAIDLCGFIGGAGLLAGSFSRFHRWQPIRHTNFSPIIAWIAAFTNLDGGHII